MTENILKINDTTAKISQFVSQVTSGMKAEMDRLRESNRMLKEQLENTGEGKSEVVAELARVKLELENSRSQLAV
jgi:cell division protein FtsB